MMILPAGQEAGLVRPRRLFVVPDRQIPRASHVPPGRSLHLVDIENLMSGPLRGRFALEAASRSFRELASVQPHDHALIGVNPKLGFETKSCWPDGLVLLGSGPDGADRVLLDAVRDLTWVAERYDRIVIGSGDGIFARFAQGVRKFGVPVIVVSGEFSLSHCLAEAADAISILPEIHPLKVVA